MEKDQNRAPRQPDYRGKLDVAAWINQDKNGNNFLSVKIADNVNLFKNEPKVEKKPQLI